MSSPPSQTPDSALRLAERFHILGHTFKRWVQSLLDGDGVSPARLRLLGVLHCRGPQIMSDLGDELGMTARYVTTLVDGLESEGLVRRAPHPTDRRATVIELTAAGTATGSALLRSFTEKTAALFRDLSEADQAELLRLVDALIAALQKRGQGRGC
jgi:DNA-binding MarR family transcriptional regulator